MTRLILGVDGGQTSTAALLAMSDGTILGTGIGGPANHIHEPGGMERMERSLRDAVTSAFVAAGITPFRVDSACFGMTGGAELVPAVVAKFLDAGTLIAVHDVVTALAGASIATPGIVVIAGTGAIAYGVDADGNEAKADGWGYLMGDEGSAYAVGLAVLRAVGRAADGRGESTLLRELVPRFWHKPDLAAVRAALYSDQMTRAEIAGLAWLASCAAESGDAAAQDILAEAGRSLARTAEAVAVRLKAGAARLSVYPTGGVFRAGKWVLEPFEQELKQRLPQIKIRPPAFAQVVGSLLLAQQQAGGAIDTLFLEQLRATLPPALLNKSALLDCAEISSE